MGENSVNENISVETKPKSSSFLVVLIIIFLALSIFISVSLFKSYDTKITKETEFSISNSFIEDLNYEVEPIDKFPEGMMYYPNMRFSDKKITYSIESDCDGEFSASIISAFNILSEKSTLSFVPSTNPEITASCFEKAESEDEKYQVIGEGGPDFIIKSGKYNIIHNGTINLYRKESCDLPITSLHEILHVLGFKHSSYNQSIMFNITNCAQKIDDEIIDELNKLYSEPSLPDLTFREVSAKRTGKYLDFNVTIANIGLSDSSDFSIIIIDENEKKVYEKSMESLKSGSGISIFASNIPVSYSGKEIRFIIDKENKIEELDKSNNLIILTAEDI
jgi:hypothetical protein